ncbi:MAG: amidohydrolase family protein [Dehalococcoidia bacterium]|nr:amidohydrolase family protein [Dehalococcoidia bacterium]
MIVDIHTHIFPPRLIEDRVRLAVLDPAFGELYGDPKAKMATAEDLLASMRQAGVDISVACGFWWHDPAIAAEHAAYLVECATASRGRIISFVPQPASLAPAGAAGIGEVREADPTRIEGGALPLLVHVSEEVGHAYRGKTGGLTPGGLWRLLEAQSGARVIAAHWGGGLPFAALMPEVRALIEADRLIFDTAASAYLYEPAVFRLSLELAGRAAVAWGSDFPLRSQARDRAEVEAALPDAADRAAVLGDNATRFLRLAAPAG